MAEQNRAERRRQPETCALCREGRPPYISMEDQRHYCMNCAAQMVHEGVYPAGRRAEDVEVHEALRTRVRRPRIVRVEPE